VLIAQPKEWPFRYDSEEEGVKPQGQLKWFLKASRWRERISECWQEDNPDWEREWEAEGREVSEEVEVIEDLTDLWQKMQAPKPIPTQEQLDRWAKEAKEAEERRIRKEVKAIIKAEEDRKMELWWREYREKQEHEEREKQEREHQEEISRGSEGHYLSTPVAVHGTSQGVEFDLSQIVSTRVKGVREDDPCAKDEEIHHSTSSSESSSRAESESSSSSNSGSIMCPEDDEGSGKELDEDEELPPLKRIQEEVSRSNSSSSSSASSSSSSDSGSDDEDPSPSSGSTSGSEDGVEEEEELPPLIKIQEESHVEMQPWIKEMLETPQWKRPGRDQFQVTRQKVGCWLIKDPRSVQEEKSTRMKDLEHYLCLDWRFRDVLENVKSLAPGPHRDAIIGDFRRFVYSGYCTVQCVPRRLIFCESVRRHAADATPNPGDSTLLTES
jgi:hypothetical protein